MKYLVTWEEYHSAVVEADHKFDADEGVIGQFNASTTYDGHEVVDIIGEDEDQGEDITELTKETKAGMISNYSHLLYNACKEFVRKCECGEARSKRSYKQMKEAIDLAEGRTTP